MKKSNLAKPDGSEVERCRQARRALEREHVDLDGIFEWARQRDLKRRRRKRRTATTSVVSR